MRRRAKSAGRVPRRLQDILVLVTLMFAAFWISNCISLSKGAQSGPNASAQQISGRVAAMQRAIDDWALESDHRGVSASVITPGYEQWVGTAGMEAMGASLRPEHLI